MLKVALPRVDFMTEQAEKVAQSISVLAEKQDYEKLRELIVSYIDTIVSRGAGNERFVYVKIMELIVLAGYGSRRVHSCFDWLLRSDFSKKLQQMLAQGSTDGVGWFLYRSVCNSISVYTQGSAAQATSSVIESALDYIANNYSKELSLDEVSQQVYMSPNYFSSCFHQRVGVTFCEYVSLLRVSKAKELLLESGMKVCDVAEKTGYENFRPFSKVFKKYVGCSPTEYRKTYGCNKEVV